MAIGASPIKVLDGTEWLRLCGVATADVAGIANPGHAHLQQLRIAAAVRLVAVGAILHDRGMFPEKWSPAFGMAAIAILVDGALNQLTGVWASMRIVATGAGDFAFAV